MGGIMFIRIHLLLLMMIVISCTEKSTDPYKNLSPVELNDAIKEVDMTIVNYDSIYVKSTENFVLSSKEVDSISISFNVDDEDNGDDFTKSLIPDYEGKSGKYRVRFKRGVKVSAGQIIDFKLTYHLSNQAILTIDSTFHMYKYPYHNAEIFFNLETNLSQNVNTLQGFELIGDDLYFCPSGGGAGIWKYNFNTKEEEVLYGTGSGDHIVANESYVFHDIDHSKLIRYNLEFNLMDLEFDSSSLSTEHSIAGLAINESYLYVLLHKNTVDDFTIVKFDFYGTVIEEIPITASCYYLAIINNIAYLKSTSHNELIRYNLTTNEFLESLILPSHFGIMEGFRIYNDKFYYVNFLGRYIYVLDFDELEPISSIIEVDAE